MKLYMHPISTTCRPVMQFIADNNLEVEQEVVDILTGAHYGEEYTKRNPNRLVPLLEDGDLALTESASILRYLAAKIDSPAYPKDLKKRAHVDEMLDWFNTNFYRDWGYNFVYPQLFPHVGYEDPAAQAAVMARGKAKTKTWLQILNDHWIGPRNNYVCGDTVTIADYLGTGFVTMGEWIHCDLSAYPNVARWIDAMKSRPGYQKVNGVFNGSVEANKGKPFQGL
ncbi:MAG TPA: glutathione S-transferase family protein [Stellaceae bacterium]|nr:glutathione S-transferase family protein [Stellaceae bacterium]